MIKLIVASFEVDDAENRLKIDLLLIIPLCADLLRTTSVIFLLRTMKSNIAEALDYP